MFLNVVFWETDGPQTLWRSGKVSPKHDHHNIFFWISRTWSGSVSSRFQEGKWFNDLTSDTTTKPVTGHLSLIGRYSLSTLPDKPNDPINCGGENLETSTTDFGKRDLSGEKSTEVTQVRETWPQYREIHWGHVSHNGCKPYSFVFETSTRPPRKQTTTKTVRFPPTNFFISMRIKKDEIWGKGWEEVSVFYLRRSHRQSP